MGEKIKVQERRCSKGGNRGVESFHTWREKGENLNFAFATKKKIPRRAEEKKLIGQKDRGRGKRRTNRRRRQGGGEDLPEMD